MIKLKLKNQKINFFILLAVFFCKTILFSCQSKTEKRLFGLWALELDSCIVLNRSWHTDICSNTLIINSNGKCDLPIICGQNINQSKGVWQLLKAKNKPDTIFFDVFDNPLFGKYMITFYKDYEAMKFKMKLENDSTILICSKSVISFTSNAKDLLDKQ